MSASKLNGSMCLKTLTASPRLVLRLGVVYAKFPLVRVGYAPLSEVHLPLRIGNSPVSHPAAYALNASDATAPVSMSRMRGGRTTSEMATSGSDRAGSVVVGRVWKELTTAHPQDLSQGRPNLARAIARRVAALTPHPALASLPQAHFALDCNLEYSLIVSLSQPIIGPRSL